MKFKIGDLVKLNPNFDYKKEVNIILYQTFVDFKDKVGIIISLAMFIGVKECSTGRIFCFKNQEIEKCNEILKCFI